MKRLFLFTILILPPLLYGVSKPRLKLLYVEMKQCPWCHRMDVEIFENPRILSKLEKMYEIKKRYKGAEDLPSFVQPRYYPTTYILSPDGKRLIDELPGYMDPAHFIDYLQELYVLESPRT